MASVVESSDRMSNSAYHRAGKPVWWIRLGSGEGAAFVTHAEMRGDSVLRAVVDLPVGTEVAIGCGPRTGGGIRETVTTEPTRDATRALAGEALLAAGVHVPPMDAPKWTDPIAVAHGIPPKPIITPVRAVMDAARWALMPQAGLSERAAVMEAARTLRAAIDTLTADPAARKAAAVRKATERLEAARRELAAAESAMAEALALPGQA